MKKYNYLSSKSTIDKKDLPKYYTVPSLIDKSYSDLRVLNNIDNEEQVPIIDFYEALEKLNQEDINYLNSGSNGGVGGAGGGGGSRLPIVYDKGGNILRSEFADLNSLRRTYSESEKSNFNLVDGTRFAPYNTKPIKPLTTLTTANRLKSSDYQTRQKRSQSNLKNGGNGGLQSNKKRSLVSNKEYLGVEDEYIPDLFTFNNFKYFGVDENAIVTSDEEDQLRKENNQKEEQKQLQLEQRTPLTISKVRRRETADDDDEVDGANDDAGLVIAVPHPRILHDERDIMKELNLHSQVQPISIGPHTENNHDNESKDRSNGLIIDETVFKVGGSPEREGDRFYLSSIPLNFSALSFSERKRTINDLLPVSLQNDTDYKNHLTKLIRRNSVSISGSMSRRSFTDTNSSTNSSPAFRYINSFSCSSITNSMPIPENINEKGSVILGKWKLDRVIGRGAFGTIRAVTNIEDPNENNTSKAMKIIDINEQVEFEKRFKVECLIWSLLKHENIIPLLDCKLTTKSFFLLMPRFSGGTLFEIVKIWETLQIGFGERLIKIRKFMIDLCNGLKYMHELGIYHGDLKLENCLIDIDPIKGDSLKLCDFGMANFFKKDSKSTVSLPSLSTKILQEKPSISRNSSPFGSSTAINEPQFYSPFSNNSNSPMPKMRSQSTTTQIPPPFYKLLQHRSSNLSPLSSRQASYQSPTPNATPRPTSPSIQSPTTPKSPQQQRQHPAILPDPHIGSLPYAPPEVLIPNPHHLDNLTDIWSLGVLIYALCVGKLPFRHGFEPRLKLMIIDVDYDKIGLQDLVNRAHGKNGVDAGWVAEVVTGCLQKDRRLRCDIDDVLNILTN